MDMFGDFILAAWAVAMLAVCIGPFIADSLHRPDTRNWWES